MADPFDRVGLVVHPSRVLRRALATIDAWARDRHGARAARRDRGGRRRAGRVLRSRRRGRRRRDHAGGHGRGARAPSRARRRMRQPRRAHRGHGRRPRCRARPGRGRRLWAASPARPARDRRGRRAADRLQRPGPRAPRRGSGHRPRRSRGERVVRFAGDGLVVATALGSTGYTSRSAGRCSSPAATTSSSTPLAPWRLLPVRRHARGTGAHRDARARVWRRACRDRRSGRGRFSSRRSPARSRSPTSPRRPADRAGGRFWAGLRRRRIVIDSPRILARDDREAAASSP